MVVSRVIATPSCAEWMASWFPIVLFVGKAMAHSDNLGIGALDCPSLSKSLG